MRPAVLGAALLALFFACAAAFAQDSGGAPDYAAWAERADQAEEIVERDRASTQALEELRASIADWRERFLAAQDVNAARIDTLQAQRDTLGEPPENGAEPPEIAERRAQLQEQLQELLAPVRRAEEAYTRADGIVGEIDATIRDRQTDELLELGPSPLNPALWRPAVGDLVASVSHSLREFRDKLGSEALRADVRAQLPLVLGLAAIGLLLILRGDQWTRRGVDMLRHGRGRGSGVFRFLLSLGQIVLPLIGIFALAAALDATGFFGTRLTLLLEQIPIWAAILLGTRWLADQAFNDNDDVAAVPLDPEDRREARTYANVLSVLIVLRSILDRLTAIDGYGPGSAAVVGFPLLALSGLALVQLGRIRVRSHSAEAAAEAGEASAFRQRLATLMARAAILLGVLGPLLAAVGYRNLGEAMVYPAIATLALFGVVVVVQEFFNALFKLWAGVSARDSDSLLPVLVGFSLMIAAVPALALIWGARPADLTELWTRFQEGFVLGEARIQPGDFVLVIVVFLMGLVATRLVQGALRTSVLPRTKIDQGGQTAIVSGLGYVGIAIAGIAAITAGGLDLSSLAIVAGALSVGIGFGLRTVVENFVSGILLLIERPISEGDWIEVGGQHGIVKDIAVRATRIETFDRFDLIVPNADLISGVVRNYTRGNVLGRVVVPVRVAYGTDTRTVERILLAIAREHDLVLMNPEPYVYFKGFGDSGMEFEIRAILRDVNPVLDVITDMNHQIAARFAEEGIQIPFPQRDLWLRNPESLSPTAPRESATGAGSGQPTGSVRDAVRGPASDEDPE
jgi:small-conductance mechanosensitive channel